jgi:hypothetical protein
VARELFPDILSYVVGTPATYSFAARNGRTLADNAPEAMLSLVLDTAVPSGLKPSVSKHLRGRNFPYVVAARPGADPGLINADIGDYSVDLINEPDFTFNSILSAPRASSFRRH